MSSDQTENTPNGAQEADFAKAFQELAQGERTATALEKQLSDMEAKIEALLAQAERDQRDVQRLSAGSSNQDATDESTKQADSS